MGGRRTRWLPSGAVGVALVSALLLLTNPVDGAYVAPSRGLPGFSWISSAYSVSHTTYHNGCQRGGYSATPAFHPGTDKLRFGAHGKALDCATTGSPHTSQSYFEQLTYLDFGFNFHAPRNGSLSIRENWTTSMESAFTTYLTPCPSKLLPANPPNIVTGYCSVELERQFEVFSNVGSNGVFGGFEPNPSEFSEENGVGWQNYTQCGPGPTGLGWSCATTVGNFDTPSELLDRARPNGSFSWNGTSTFSIWVNVSGLTKGGSYELAFAIQIALIVFDGELNLSQDWRSAGAGYLRLARPGTFAQLDAVTFH